MKVLRKYLQVTVSFLPHFQHKHLPPAKEGLEQNTPRKGVTAPVTVMALQLFHATLHGLSKMMQKHKKNQPALLFAENSMLIHDSTWAKDLHFIMCFINFRVLEITYNITGSEWISI